LAWVQTKGQASRGSPECSWLREAFKGMDLGVSLAHPLAKVS